MSRGRGEPETERLKKNLSEQLDRLMAQLVDLEQSKDQMEEEDYGEQYKDTIEQLEELNVSLNKMKAGNLSLLDDISSMQLAIRAAIGTAFHTPEILALFAAKQPGQLRERLSMVERDFKVNKLPKDDYNRQKVEILSALLKLRVALSPDEQDFLSANNSAQMKDFLQADKGASANKVLKLASSSAK